MLRKLGLFFVALLALQSNVAAQHHGFGVGVIFGEPSGINGKHWLSNRTAIVGAVAWSVGKEDALHLHGDYLFHDFDLLHAERGKMALYYGLGGRIRFEDDSVIGARIPVGLNYLFAKAPVDLFLELVPMLDLAPDTKFDMNGGVGVRFFFGK
ncbi:hypothetical protein HUU05_03375 [candidate division KSB1 bacterium]|nr:hypothetical protein [candidate division KSB1 bacterium]